MSPLQGLIVCYWCDTIKVPLLRSLWISFVVMNKNRIWQLTTGHSPLSMWPWLCSLGPNQQMKRPQQKLFESKVRQYRRHGWRGSPEQRILPMTSFFCEANELLLGKGASQLWAFHINWNLLLIKFLDYISTNWIKFNGIHVNNFVIRIFLYYITI